MVSDLILTRAPIIKQARLRHILFCLSNLHYPGTSRAKWSGDANAGSFWYDNGSGDALVLMWDAGALVGLAFAHESSRSRAGTEERTPLLWLPGLPEHLLVLAEDAVQSLGGIATSGLWVEGDGSAQLSDAIAADTMWAEGAEMFVRFGMSPQEALFGTSGQNWGELTSLNPDQLKLGVRLADPVAQPLTSGVAPIQWTVCLRGQHRLS